MRYMDSHYRHYSFNHNSQDVETTQMPINRWIDLKKDVVHIYRGMLFSHEKGWYSFICNNIDGLWPYYAKWDKSEREW